MNLIDTAKACEEKFLAKAIEKLGDASKVPTFEISRFCRMVSMYCEAEGNVTKSFLTAMTACTNKIKEVEGMEEIMEELNECPK